MKKIYSKQYVINNSYTMTLVPVYTNSEGVVEILDKSKIVINNVKTNSITELKDIEYSYTITCEHFKKYDGTGIVEAVDNESRTKSFNVEMTVTDYNLTFETIPADAIVKVNNEVVAKSITVPALSTVEYEVSADGYRTQKKSVTMSVGDIVEKTELLQNNATIVAQATLNGNPVYYSSAKVTVDGVCEDMPIYEFNGLAGDIAECTCVVMHNVAQGENKTYKATHTKTLTEGENIFNFDFVDDTLIPDEE